MIVNLTSEQIKWLKTIVQFRIEDEEYELQDLASCKRTDDIEICRKRIEVWKSILDELNNPGENK